MPTKDPKYIRLSPRMSRGAWVDVKSKFGITGADVVEFPEDAAAARFARDALRKGIYEEAGQAEYDEVQEGNFDTEIGSDPEKGVIVMLPAGSSLPEYKIQELAKEARDKVQKAARRRAVADGELDEDDDEDEEPRKSHSAKRASATKKAKKKAKEEKAAASDDDDDDSNDGEGQGSSE